MTEERALAISRWARRIWWALLSAGLSIVVYRRLPAIVGGTASNADLALLAILMGLLLSPLFSEVSLFGVSLKREIDALRSDLKLEFLVFKTDIQQSLNVQATLNQNIAIGTLPTPAPDKQLPVIEQRAKRILADAFFALGQSDARKLVEQLPVDDQRLIGVRVLLERELRRIVGRRELTPYGRQVVRPLDHVVLLREADLVSPDMAQAIREVYLVCSLAVHAEEVTPAQRAFVEGVAPGLLAQLRAIE